jgi:hypothetical protein
LSFFVSLTRKRLSYAVVCQTFRQLVDNAGVGTGAPSKPRLHDYADLRVMPTPVTERLACLGR